MMQANLRRAWRDIVLLRSKSEDAGLDWRQKWRLWRKGFVSQSYHLYSLHRNDAADYVSDLVRLKKTPQFNGYFSVMLYDKLYFYRMMSAFAEHIPEVYGVMKAGVFLRTNGKGRQRVEDLLELCRSKGKLIFKPITGNGGEGVKLLCRHDGGWRLNNRDVSQKELIRRLGCLEDYVVTEFIQQHSYAAEVYPGSANTLRIQTMFDYDKGVPFVAASSHRFGMSDSAPADNCGLGGLSVYVDWRTGRLGQVTRYQAGGRFTTLSDHPETGAKIEGIIVPRWDVITSRILDMAASLSFLCWVAWDIIVTPDGFKVIEGNNYPSLNLIQVDGGFLKDKRIRKFIDRRVSMLEVKGRRHKLPFRL